MASGENQWPPIPAKARVRAASLAAVLAVPPGGGGRRLLTANFGWARVPGLVKVLSKVKVLLIRVSDRNTGLWAASIRMKLTPRPQICIREMLRATNVMSLPSLGQTGDAARSQRLIIYYLQYYF